MDKYEVFVGNIGRIYDGDDYKEARLTYLEYVKRSQDGIGRAAGESVTWMKNDEIIAEHIGQQDIDDEDYRRN